MESGRTIVCTRCFSRTHDIAYRKFCKGLLIKGRFIDRIFQHGRTEEDHKCVRSLSNVQRTLSAYLRDLPQYGGYHGNFFRRACGNGSQFHKALSAYQRVLSEHREWYNRGMNHKVNRKGTDSFYEEGNHVTQISKP